MVNDLDSYLKARKIKSLLIISKNIDIWIDGLSDSIDIDQIVYFLHYPTMTLFEAFNVNGVKVQNQLGEFEIGTLNNTFEEGIVFKERRKIKDSRSNLQGK